MIVKNEQENLPRCLASVEGIFDEIMIVDTGSVNRKKEIAREFGAKVFDFVWIDDFAAARNEALSHATTALLVRRRLRAVRPGGAISSASSSPALRSRLATAGSVTSLPIGHESPIRREREKSDQPGGRTGGRPISTWAVDESDGGFTAERAG